MVLIDGYGRKSCYPNAPTEGSAASPREPAAPAVGLDPFAQFQAIFAITAAENRRVLEAQRAATHDTLTFLIRAHEQDRARLREHYEAMVSLLDRRASDTTKVELKALQAKVEELEEQLTEESETAEEKPEDRLVADGLEALGSLVKDVGPKAIRAGLSKLGVLDDD